MTNKFDFVANWNCAVRIITALDYLYLLLQ